MFVLDASITMAWCFEDERTTYTEAVLQSLSEESCIVPQLWASEVANILQIGMKRKRITESEVINFCTMLSNLPILIDYSQHKILDLFEKCKTSDLTAYDTQYFYLAHDNQIPIATLDKKIKEAAQKLKIPLFLAKENFE